jgi:hypothetical protein
VDILDIRAAFIFFQAWLDPFLLPVEERKDVTPDRERWIATFGRLEGDADNEEPLTLPWLGDGIADLWADYFESPNARSIKGRRAWSLVLPLRMRTLAVAKPTIRLDGRGRVEAFVYPHGVAVIVNVSASGPTSLEQVTARMQTIRHGQSFEVETGGGVRRRSLEQVAADAIAESWPSVLPQAPSAPIAWDPAPLSVMTFVHITGTPLPLAAGGALHSSLNVLAGGNDRVSKAAWDRSLLKEEFLGKDNILYGRDRGRVLWCPEHFKTRKPGSSQQSGFLGGLHRDLTLASMHTEGLLGLLSMVGNRLRSGYGPTLPYWLRAEAKNAAGSVGRIYGGKVWAQHTASLRAQIDKINRGAFRADTNLVRDYFDMPPLHADSEEMSPPTGSRTIPPKAKPKP